MSTAHRFFIDNLGVNATITTTANNGIISGAAKRGTGSAGLIATGDYTYPNTLLYTVQIHNIGSGTQIGQAQYRWRTNETTIDTWEASNVTTHANAQTLNHDVLINFVANTGNHFAINDTFQFQAIASYGIQNAFDGTRTSAFEFAPTGTIVLQPNRTVTVRNLILYDHTLSAQATVTLQGHTANSWNTPTYSQSLSITTNPFIYDLPIARTYPYWRLLIADGTQSTAHIGTLYLGDAFSLSRNAARGSSIARSYVTQEETLATKLRYGQTLTSQLQFELKYPLLDESDLALLKTLYATVYTQATRLMPFLFQYHADSLEYLCLVTLQPEFTQTRLNADLAGDLSLTLTEVPLV